MKALRLTAVLLAIGTLLAACGKQEDEAPSTANGLLALVPANTPYLFANLQPIPATIMDAWLARAEPFLAVAQEALLEARQELAAGDEAVDASFANVAQAVLAELDGKLNRAGLESLGISLEAGHVFHGNGLFPVARVGLGDAQALRAAITRIESSSGQSIPELESAGKAYWRIADQGHGMAVYIAILDDHLALAAVPMSAEAEFLPAFLAQQAPAASHADGQVLSTLNRDKGYTPYGSGYLDTRLVAEELLDPASRTSGYLAALGEHDATAIDPACAAEARDMTRYVPRMVMGVTDLTDNVIAVQYQAEIDRPLAAELVNLVSEVPAASGSTDNLLSASLAIRVGRLLEFARAKALALAAAPFACPQLQHLNRRMSEVAGQLNQPMPLPIGNLMGVRGVVTGIDLANPDPETSRGLVSLEVESPQMLIGAASMLVPNFEELGIEPGADPVQIPQELLTMVTPEFELYAVMTNRAIGLSFGPGMRDTLVPFMEEKGGNDGAFFSVDYDMASLAQLEHHASDGDHPQAARQQRLVEAYRAMAGRSRVSFRFVPEGLTIDSRTTFR